MMDVNAHTLNAQPPKQPELGRLKAASERIGMAANRVDNFIQRFHGPRPPSGTGSEVSEDNYRNDLDSLFTQIERLESYAVLLDQIG